MDAVVFPTPQNITTIPIAEGSHGSTPTSYSGGGLEVARTSVLSAGYYGAEIRLGIIDNGGSGSATFDWVFRKVSGNYSKPFDVNETAIIGGCMALYDDATQELFGSPTLFNVDLWRTSLQITNGVIYKAWTDFIVLDEAVFAVGIADLSASGGDYVVMTNSYIKITKIY